jgi:hypothetical protein
MAIKNLPGIFENRNDGNLTIVPVNNAPIVLVLGTASKGPSESIYRVDRVSDAAKVFGKDGTLARGLFEAASAGGLNLRLFRIGASPAVLTLANGSVITTVAKDDSAGTDYTIRWTLSTKRLEAFRVSDEVLVYDNNPADPLEAVDLQEITVDGDLSAETQSDIGSGTVGEYTGTVTLLAADAVSGTTFVAGGDGLELSRMEMYEALHNAYELLDSVSADVIMPMNVFLDDKNVMDMDGATVSGLSLHTLTDYPSAGSSSDALGKFYVEEYDGVNHFWWWFPHSPNAASADTEFTANGGANIYPSVGSASATTKADGTTLTGSDFHEVNFAYQLANFCYVSSRDNTEMTGVVGVKPPKSFALKDVSNWIGELPVAEEDANGNLVIGVGDNGTGLLGNKFMSGRRADASGTGTPGLTIDSINGLYNGGFIATDDGWLDGVQLKDDNDRLVDLGKYISIVAAQPILSNPSSSQPYVASGASTYGGMYSVLPADSAPTNKQLKNIRLPFRVSVSKLDLLAGQRYVMFHAKTRGIVVSDAPTASRPESDYQRLSTMRQVKAAVDAIRRVAEPFLGESLTSAKIAALDTAIDGVLKNLVRDGVLVRYDSQVTSTPAQRVLGQATCELVLVPAFELRQLNVVVSLAAS